MLPVTLVVVGIALQLAWLRELPATVVIHWSFDGPDGYGLAWTVPVLLGVLGLGLPAIFGAILAHSVTPAGLTATQKLLAGASVFADTLLAIVLTASLAIQREPIVEHAQILTALAVGAGIALVLAAGSWFALGTTIPSTRRLDPVAPIAVAPGERVAWVGRATLAGSVTAVLVATFVLAAGAVAFAIATTGAWPLAIVPVVLALAVPATSAWNVRADSDGLTVRGGLGWPSYRVPLTDIASAGTTTVIALGEFGGYGIRWGLGRRFGIITRGGEALEVQRRDGRAVVVTVDDAATAAGVLTALAARRAER